MDAVELRQKLIEREEIKVLKRVYDVGVFIKVSLSTANARDMLSLKISETGSVDQAQFGCFSANVCVVDETCDHDDVMTSVEKALQDNPPIQITEGGLIREGYHPELDDLRAISPREASSLRVETKKSDRHQ